MQTLILLITAVMAIGVCIMRLMVRSRQAPRPDLAALAGPLWNRWPRKLEATASSNDHVDWADTEPFISPVLPGDHDSSAVGDSGFDAPQAIERGIKVMMVGFAGSGKSTFLAAMWQYFSSEGRSGIIFTTDDGSRRELDRYCHDILDGRLPAQDIGATREWKFTVRAEGLSGNLTDTFTLSYFDYPGDQLDRFFQLPRDNASAEPADPQVLAALEQYDVITGILDGDKIFEIMQDRMSSDYSKWLYKLFRLISMKGDKTVHLVLTKHDRLIGKYTLEQIVAKLRGQYLPFDQFCESQRTKHTRKRLIAVAALGVNTFATRADNGAVVLHPEAKWDFTDARRPIVCTLPDAIEGELRKLRGAAPGFRPSPASRGLNWRVYPLLAWAAEVFASDVDMKFPLDHAIDLSLSASALMHLFRLVAQEKEFRIPGSRRSLRRRTPATATSDRAKALEAIITEWTEDAQRIALDQTACYILRPRETGS